MKETISLLLKEHKKILEELHLIEEALAKEHATLSTTILEKLQNLKEYTSSLHHKREEETLFKWMLEQNPNADASIINRIKEEHVDLEKRQGTIISDLTSFTKGLAKVSQQSILFDITDFKDLYREHIQREEKFIFEIAKGLLMGQQA